VLLVNTIIDGMNLVAKEGCLLNEKNGVLILSEGAGAAIQLGEDALTIAPADVEGTAEALYQALTMPLAERRRRAERLRHAVETDNVAVWFQEQLRDIVNFAIPDERVLTPMHSTEPTANEDMETGGANYPRIVSN
jgi:trehalose 6-phosphate synthase